MCVKLFFVKYYVWKKYFTVYPHLMLFHAKSEPFAKGKINFKYFGEGFVYMTVFFEIV